MHTISRSFANRRRIGQAAACLGLMAVLAGCVTVNSLPEIDLSAPGWNVYKGQALWTPKADKPPLAGELIAARNVNGDVLVSFSKPPFPIFTARTAGDIWHLEVVERGRSYSGRGTPPRRFVWFLLPAVLEGGPVPEGWTLSGDGASRITMHNRSTGEKILVVMDQ